MSLYLYNGESGSQTTASGSGTAGYADASLYYQAHYRSPEAVCVDANNTIYVADTGNHAIRQAIQYGAVITLAGNGTAGFVNANGTAARLNSPRGICRDPAGNL